MMHLCAYKDVGKPAKLCYTNDPFKKFEELFGAPAIFTPIDCAVSGLSALALSGGTQSSERRDAGLSAVTHPQPDFNTGINLELRGVILYGPVVLINIDDDGLVTSLTEDQVKRLRHDAGLIAS